MNYKIEIAPEAEVEIILGKKWYEEQQPGLGKDFSATIKEHINSLRNPRIEHKLVFEDVRRMLTKRFPFVIYYQRDDDRYVIKILAVLHNRQQQFSPRT